MAQLIVWPTTTESEEMYWFVLDVNSVKIYTKKRKCIQIW